MDRCTIPIVATTLKRPDATRSISSSICCSVEEGELRSRYVEWLCEEPAGVEGVEDEADAAAGGGSKENKDGDGEINERYWSMTYVDACDISTARMSLIALYGVPIRRVRQFHRALRKRQVLPVVL